MEAAASHTEPRRDARPFFLAVVALVVFAVGQAMWRDPTLLGPMRAALLLIPTGLHLGLHGWMMWSARAAAPSQPVTWSAVYLLVQAALAIAMGTIAGNPTMTLVLCAPLMGQATSLLPRRWALLTVAGLLAAALAHAGIAEGWPGLTTGWLGASVFVALFVFFYVEMFERQARARRRADQALAELDEAHAELAAYAAQVEELTRAAERQRVARELHDTLGQSLAGLILQLEAIEPYLEKGEIPKVRAILERVRQRARAALAEARHAIDDLRSAGDAALPEVIRRESQRFSEATGIDCTVEVDEPLPLSPEQTAHAARVVSEGLANCARHAHARRVSVGVRARDGGVVLEITDDGVGFDPAGVAVSAGHWGLLGLRERARLAGGALEIDSAAGRGTKLRFVLPAERT